jgi:hypothetical protein
MLHKVEVYNQHKAVVSHGLRLREPLTYQCQARMIRTKTTGNMNHILNIVSHTMQAG